MCQWLVSMRSEQRRRMLSIELCLRTNKLHRNESRPGEHVKDGTEQREHCPLGLELFGFGSCRRCRYGLAVMELALYESSENFDTHLHTIYEYRNGRLAHKNVLPRCISVSTQRFSHASHCPTIIQNGSTRGLLACPTLPKPLSAIHTSLKTRSHRC